MTNGSTQTPAGASPVSANSEVPLTPVDRFKRGGIMARALFIIAIAFSSWQILTAAGIIIEGSLVIRSIHVGFVLLLVFLLHAHLKIGWKKWLDVGLGASGFVLAFYHWIFEGDLILRAGMPTTSDLIVGCAMVALVFEAARRVMGIGLPIVCGLFLAYGLLGQYLPSPLNHRGYDFSQVVDQMFLGTEGIFGIPTYVSSTYIFLFIVFGSFLERAGIVELFTGLAMGAVGNKTGGPAKVAVVSSAMMGTVNGSGIANVVTTGQFTIPLMKRSGFSPTFSGAVEATASMGGQIMPPVMGAVAFIMAETLNIPYIEVVRAAIIPALLYFGTVLWMVHLEASRLGLGGMDIPNDQPTALQRLREKWYLLLPLVVLVSMLFMGFTPLFAGTMGLAFTALLILGLGLTANWPNVWIRTAFWIALAFFSSAFLEWGIEATFLLIAALAVLLFFFKGGGATLRLCIEALEEGARNALPVATACALVGVIIGVMTLTGAANSFARVIVDVGENSLFLSLLLTMLACLVLGMGIPTIPNYIITSSLVGPALEQLGVPLLVSHMFVFYFGIMADLTPPVALAAFAAAPIAKASGMRIGLQCMKIAIAGFVVPFIAVYSPVLMLQDGGPVAEHFGYPLAVAYVCFKAAIAVGLWGIAAIGFMRVQISWPYRLWAIVGASFLVLAQPLTDEIGLVIAFSFIAILWFKSRTVRAPALVESGK
ncbi:TRAP transporter permease [Sulfitobacter sp. AS92]|uniref:TRAP transporter permease n=1 Tax=Sulfitobacter sp. AS92 TaxID=3135783 RepID=UPI003180B991